MSSDTHKGGVEIPELASFLCTDLGGVTRGRAFPVSDLDARFRTGVGWVPINQTITPFDHIPDSELWGSSGDIRLIGDPETRVRLDLGLGAGPLHFYLCDIYGLDGAPWPVCARGFLKQSMRMLEEQAGLRVVAAFEHEFAFLDAEPGEWPEQGNVIGSGFGHSRLREITPYGEYLVEALTQAGQEPETFLPEFELGQFEITCRPGPALAAADRSVIVRELAHDVAQQLGRRVTFSPKVTPERLGNGVHIHFSLTDLDGKPVMRDKEKAGGLSDLAGQFAAGVVDHLPALCALTAPSVLSYERLVPHQWSAAYTCLGLQNREAALRICPGGTLGGGKPAQQYNLEYRAADATANPYLALGAIIRAGLEGLTGKLETPPLVNSDPDALDEASRKKLGIKRLPTSAAEALSALKSDAVAKAWFAPELRESYFLMRQAEIESLSGLSAEELCRKYRNVF